MDKVLAQLKLKMSMDDFDPMAPSITQRNPFMGRMHRKFPNPPPQALKIQLESFSDPITMKPIDS